jgi:putative transposase
MVLQFVAFFFLRPPIHALTMSLCDADFLSLPQSPQIRTKATVRQRWPWLRHLLADGVYARGRLMSEAAYRDFVIDIVRKLSDQQGFQPLPRRWVVERTFGWMMRWRRLVRDYEERCDVSEAMIGVAMSSLMLRRIAHP